MLNDRRYPGVVQWGMSFGRSVGGRWSVVEVDLTMRSCLLVYCGKVSRMVVVLLNDN
jgi:hypothetical protein